MRSKPAGRGQPSDRDLAIADLRAIVANEKFEQKDRDAALAKLEELGAAP